MKKYLFVLLLLTLFSCNRQTDFEKKLLKSKWVYYPYYKVENKLDIRTYLKFYEDGTAKNLDIDSAEENFNFYEGKKTDDTWEYSQKDKKLIIFGNEFKVLSVEDDTIRLFKKDEYKVLLFKIEKNKS